jgi:hypothetical protein
MHVNLQSICKEILHIRLKVEAAEGAFDLKVSVKNNYCAVSIQMSRKKPRSTPVWPDWAIFRIGVIVYFDLFLENNVWKHSIFPTFCHRKSSAFICGEKMCWTSFWALFSQNNLVTLVTADSQIGFGTDLWVCWWAWERNGNWKPTTSPPTLAVDPQLLCSPNFCMEKRVKRFLFLKFEQSFGNGMSPYDRPN